MRAPILSAGLFAAALLFAACTSGDDAAPENPDSAGGVGAGRDTSASGGARITFRAPAYVRDTSGRIVVAQVVVDGGCTSEGMWVSISPWSVRVSSVGEVEWSLASSALSNLTISPKRGDPASKWPFPPGKITNPPDKPKGKINKPASVNPYEYDIEFTCTDPADQKTYRALIDPEVIIFDGKVDSTTTKKL